MKLKIASVQMSARPYALEENLAKASRLIAEAASQGAKLAVLPELFNVGYRYDDRNFTAAEPLDGQTITWMAEQAALHDLYLAGTLLAREGGDIYNTMPLVAPNGVMQIYRKMHPFMWENSYFRPGPGPRIAQTPWGRWGMLICWDIAYVNPSAAYRHKVDLLIISSAPPMFPQGDVVYSTGERIPFHRINLAAQQVRDKARYWYYEGIGELARWVGAPAVHAVMCGTFASPLPLSRLALFVSALSGRPGVLRYALRSSLPEVVAPFAAYSAIFDRDGAALAVAPEGEGAAIAEVEVPGKEGG
jgi:predicted amidohydrolase